MIDEDFLTLIANTIPAGIVIEKGKISKKRLSPRVFFQRNDENNALDLVGTQGLTETTFDIEIGSLNDDNTAQTLADQLNAQFGRQLTTLDGDITSTAKTIAVVSAAGLPIDGFPFIITIDSEEMAITAANGTSLTVTRGYRGSTKAIHSDGTGVVISGLNGYRGNANSGWIHGIFVSDQHDEYEPRLLDADEGYHVVGFQALVIHEG